ncbi:hypothetical protein [Acidovorax sp.]|uniref:hypothetical protein n=1 Tax=Acidovorax sp. TaxID=1872122 RepID=UPI0031D5D1C0
MYVKIPDCGKGVNLDLTPEELEIGVWSNCTNMRFYNGYAQRFNGMARIFDVTTHTPHYITPYQTVDDRYWVTAGNTKAYLDNGVGRTEITRQVEIAMTSIVRTTAVLATVTTTAAHGLSTGNTVTVFNTIPAAFNVSSVSITVTGATTFTYPLTTDPVTNATTVGGLVVLGAAANNYTGGRDDRWSGGTLGGVLVMNNGVDVPQYLQPGLMKLRPMQGWNSLWRCAFMVPYKQYLMAFDVTKDIGKADGRNPHMMKWSTSAIPGALPTSWDSTDPKLDAGEVDIAETPDLLVDALQLGDALIVYKERSMYAVRFVGQPFIFQIQRIPGESGMLTRGCGAITPMGHVVLTGGDVVVNNGQGVESIADGWVRKYIFDNIDSTNYKRAFVTTNPERNEVLICFPTPGDSDCTKAAVWNWKSKTWGLRDLASIKYGAVGQIDNFALTTWAADSDAWDLDASTWNEDEYSPNESRLLMVGPEKIVIFDVSNSDDASTPLPGVLERTGMFLDDAQAMKLLKSLQMRIDATAGAVVTVNFGYQMVPDSATVWGADMTYIVGTDLKVDGFAQGRYLAIRISCSTPWRLRAVDLDVVKTGSF